LDGWGFGGWPSSGEGHKRDQKKNNDSWHKQLSLA
jgi:hypothetical protein